MKLLIPDGIDSWQVGGEHMDLCCFFGGFDQAEGFVEISARTVDAVLRPDDETRGFHLFGGGLPDLVRAAEHPRQHVHAVREHHDALGTHLPERARELALVKAVDIGHRQKICRVTMHNHAIFRGDSEPRSVAHHVRRKLRGEFPAVCESPKKLRRLAVLRQPDEAEIDLRRVLHVLEILTRAGDEEGWRITPIV